MWRPAARGTPKPSTACGDCSASTFSIGTAAIPSEAIYTLPIPEDGVYQISLLYPSGKDRASNVPVTIQHADGKAD
jgi:hypothetical protein